VHRERDFLKGLDVVGRQRRLRRMMLNNLLERIEHERAQARDYRRELEVEEGLQKSSNDLQHWLAADTPTPEEKAELSERGVELAQALMCLPEREREALILQKYHGWTLSRIAEHLHCTSGAVAGLHARGLKRLRERLVDRRDEVP
jgi:RNA polymerase sigma factor (sigma-70 family)